MKGFEGRKPRTKYEITETATKIMMYNIKAIIIIIIIHFPLP